MKQLSIISSYQYNMGYLLMLAIFACIGLFNRSFAHVGYQGIYIVELSLVLIAGYILLSQKFSDLLRMYSKKRFLLFYAFFAYGCVHLFLGLHYGFLAARHSLIVLYSLSFLFAFVSLLTDYQRIRTVFSIVLIISTVFISAKLDYYKSQDIFLNYFEQHRVLHNEVDIICASLSVIGLLVYRKAFPIYLPYLLLVPNIMIIFLTAKRSAMLGLLLCAAACLILVRKSYIRPRAILIYGLGIVALFGAALLIINAYEPGYLNYMAARVNVFSEQNVSWRLTAWQRTWQTFLEAPVFGVGFGVPLINYSISGNEAPDPHNSFLAILARTGVVGFFLFISIIGQTLKLYFDLYRREESTEVRRIIMVFYLSFIYMLTFAFFNVVLENQYQGIFFWFSLAGAYIISNIKDVTTLSSQGQALSPTGLKITSASVILVLLVFLGFSLSPENFPKDVSMYSALNKTRLPVAYGNAVHGLEIKQKEDKLLVRSKKDDSSGASIFWVIPEPIKQSPKPLSEYSIYLQLEEPLENELKFFLTDYGSTHFLPDQPVQGRKDILIPFASFMNNNKMLNRDTLHLFIIEFPYRPHDIELKIRSVRVIHNTSLANALTKLQIPDKNEIVN